MTKFDPAARVESYCADAQSNINNLARAANFHESQLLAQVAQAQALLALVGAVSRLADRLPKSGVS